MLGLGLDQEPAVVESDCARVVQDMLEKGGLIHTHLHCAGGEGSGNDVGGLPCCQSIKRV